MREFLAPQVFSDSEADDAFAEYWAAYVEAWRPFPDAVPALRRALGQGLAVGILTNGDAADQRRKVRATGLGELGIPVFASSELPAAKPDPRAFAAACAALGAAPGECLMIGDSLENDIAGAQNAAMPAILLDRYGRHRGVSVQRVTSLDELRFDGPDR
ncbi:hypothetical protein GCM10009606_23250 [Nocardioides aquiterrae]|uniref:HAD family hydrolase n=1 Tax=Nocardioides aquiterrae TaxID=203799 RepID=A0ABN1UDE7_9ACTN